MKLIKTSSLLLVLALLAGCSHVAPNSHQYVAWRERQKALQAYNKWHITGKLSITHQRKRDIADFTWQQDQQAYLLKISAPLNLHAVTIAGDQQQAEFCQTGQACVKSSSIDRLLFDVLGWRLPFANLHYWIKSLPAPTKVSDQQFDAYDHLVAFKQQGWLIEYGDFQSVAKYDLPRVIKLQHQDLFVKIKINSQA